MCRECSDSGSAHKQKTGDLVAARLGKGSALFRLRLQASLGDLHQFGKGGLILGGDIGEHLAVDLDLSPLEALDKSAVSNVIRPTGGIDAHIPQGAEFTLLITAVAVGILPAVI